MPSTYLYSRLIIPMHLDTDIFTHAFEKKYATSLQNPPQTMEGHINHENGVVNDYRGRAIYEFFQNAIDRAEKAIWIHLDKTKRTLTIANDGEPFSIQDENQRYSDFSAVCSINTSSKNQNESIGNKGVGFKSCWEYTQSITVVSRHECERWGFRLRNPLDEEFLSTFATNEIKEWLTNREVQDVLKRKKKLPSFYFPQRLNGGQIHISAGMGPAVTIITFEDISEEKLRDLDAKIKEFARHQIFFVRQLGTLSNKEVTLRLSIDEGWNETLHTQPNESQWLVTSKELEGEAQVELLRLSKELNYPVLAPKVAIAFPLKDEESDDRSLFYCYLPTQEKGFFVRNA